MCVCVCVKGRCLLSECFFLFKDRIKIWVSVEFSPHTHPSANNSLWNQSILTGSAGFESKTWRARSGCDEEHKGGVHSSFLPSNWYPRTKGGGGGDAVGRVIYHPPPEISKTNNAPGFSPCLLYPRSVIGKAGPKGKGNNCAALLPRKVCRHLKCTKNKRRSEKMKRGQSDNLQQLKRLRAVA